MSRTVRRIGKSLDQTREHGYTHDWKRGIDGHLWESYKLTGKDLSKGWWRVDGDSLKYYAHKSKYRDWGSVRNLNNVDLNKWINDSEHEPIFFEEINKADWTD